MAYGKHDISIKEIKNNVNNSKQCNQNIKMATAKVVRTPWMVISYDSMIPYTKTCHT